MEQKLFEQLLEQVANYQHIRADMEGSGGWKKNPDEEVPTVIKIMEIKHVTKPCEDCGRMVEGRAKDMRIYKYANGRGCKEHCLTCGLHKDPYTGEFNMTGTEASRAWTNYSRYPTHNRKTR
jgi:hypothetical protein